MLSLLWFELRALRGPRARPRDGDSDVRYSAGTVAEMEAALLRKDREIERINEQLAIVRRDEVARDTTVHTHVEPAEPRAEVITVVEEVAPVAPVAVAASDAAATDARLSAQIVAELDSRLRHRDLDLERIRDELARLRHDLERQRETAARTHTTHTRSAAPHHETVTVVDVPREAAVVVDTVAMTDTVAAPAAPHQAPHRPAATAGVIDEADWSVTHFRVVIGAARAQKHDRAQAQQDIIRLSDLMLAHHPDNAEAVCFAHVSKAEALAEQGDHAAALHECDTVIVRHAAATAKAVRTQLAHALFAKAAIHAQAGEVTQCCAALDQWEQVYGIFDQRMVLEDVRFAHVVNVSEFQVYIAHKTR